MTPLIQSETIPGVSACEEDVHSQSLVQKQHGLLIASTRKKKNTFVKIKILQFFLTTIQVFAFLISERSFMVIFIHGMVI